MKKLTVMYFSPTGTGKSVAESIASGMTQKQIFSENVQTVDLTRPNARTQSYSFDEQDVLLLAYPVYGGRIPNIITSVLNNLTGSSTPAIIVSVYGNRDYEDALVEGHDILAKAGFNVIAAGAFIGEHSYSAKVAAGRPDASDLETASRFGVSVTDKLEKNDLTVPDIKGNRPYKMPMPDMPFAPKTTNACDNCGICVDKCPVQAISPENPANVASNCILCSACVKSCPKKAKYIDAEKILQIVSMLETKFTARKEPELFI